MPLPTYTLSDTLRTIIISLPLTSSPYNIMFQSEAGKFSIPDIYFSNSPLEIFMTTNYYNVNHFFQDDFLSSSNFSPRFLHVYCRSTSVRVILSLTVPEMGTNACRIFGECYKLKRGCVTISR